jgi:hypothetical protein
MYKLSYKYRGSAHVWDHTFYTLKEYVDWAVAFAPFVVFVGDSEKLNRLW